VSNSTAHDRLNKKKLSGDTKPDSLPEHEPTESPPDVESAAIERVPLQATQSLKTLCIS
jgi:hypothetical protein